MGRRVADLTNQTFAHPISLVSASRGSVPRFLRQVLVGSCPQPFTFPEHPDHCSWGGRYDPAEGLYTNVTDSVTGLDGTVHRTNQATVWRWRAAFQNDFAARINWTLTSSRTEANHPAVSVLNGTAGEAPAYIQVRSGDAVPLSAAGSNDPDHDPLHYRWWQYAEADGGRRGDPVITLDRPTEQAIRIVAPDVKEERRFHIILEVTDAGTPPLTRYRRAIVMVSPRQ
ncbi:hypothetical protein BH10PSE12_BH10PSE12_28070 [soil metagenome]